jgi:signal peptidase I
MPAVALTLLALFILALLWGGVTLLRRPPAGPRKPYETAAWVTLAVLAAGFFAAFFPMAMPTASMENTVISGDRLLVERVSRITGRAPRRDELVLLHPPFDPQQVFLKRVAGVPGDRIRFADKRLLRNGAPVDEPYAIHRTSFTEPYRDNFPSGDPPQPTYATAGPMLRESVQGGEVVVPPGKLFVLGDNRDNSLDSRYWGFVDQAAVIGRPVLIYSSVGVPVRFRILSKLPSR